MESPAEAGSAQIFILLLEPANKKFECIKLDITRELGQAATAADILDIISTKATEPALVAQKHAGLCRRKGDVDNTIVDRSSGRASTCIRDGEILIAIPFGFTAEKCRVMVQKILEKNPKVAKILKRPDPLAPRSSNHKNRSKQVSGSKISTSRMSLEAIVEDDGDSRSERDMEGSVGSSIEPSSLDDIKCSDITSSANSNSSDIKHLLSQRIEKDNNVRKDIEALIRRESARKLLEKKVRQNAKAQEMARAEIEGRIKNEVKDAISEKEDILTAEKQIERLALEASEIETSLISEHSFSGEVVPPPTFPERISNLFDTKGQANDENTSTSVVETFRTKCKGTKRRLRQARIATKQTIRGFIEENPLHVRIISAAIVAAASALYHIYSPSSMGIPVYVVLIVILATLAFVIRRRKRRRRRAMRRRSRSLSMTPRRKGSIMGIMGRAGEGSSDCIAR